MDGDKSKFSNLFNTDSSSGSNDIGNGFVSDGCDFVSDDCGFLLKFLNQDGKFCI